ncbi:MAG: dienelactone hydrolase family protein [Gammaproteobacteria bacterium]|nr:dienelactone hydrolase family protein [Gammaproteobacteria bacterium]
MCDINGCGSHANLPPIKVDPERRRLFLRGVASLPLATVLAYPDLASAAADSLDKVSATLRDGADVGAYLALPDAEKAPAVLLIHEWWGLNDQINSVAAELATLGYVALAVDLYGGEVADTAEGARSLMQAVDAERATETLTTWIDWLKGHERTTGKVATMGWCFGGGWSVNASIAAPVDATVIYYGNVAKSADQLESLEGPVLGHFATQDGWVNEEMVDGFKSAMEEAGKADMLTVHWYDADHAFANPTGARYDAEDASLAWERTRAFLEENLS